MIFCAGFSTKRREDFWFCGRILPLQHYSRAQLISTANAHRGARSAPRQKNHFKKHLIIWLSIKQMVYPSVLLFATACTYVYDSSLLLLLQYAKKTQKIVPNIWPNPVQSTITETYFSFCSIHHRCILVCTYNIQRQQRYIISSDES